MVREILNSRELLIKNQTKVISQFEFFVKNCQPDTGEITTETAVSIENRDILNLAKIKLAVLKSNTPDFNYREENYLEEYIHDQFFGPYFTSGVQRYVERGEFLRIENLEFFVLSCVPDEGYITQETKVTYKFGLSKDRCLEKIQRYDSRLAQSLDREEAKEIHRRFSRDNQEFLTIEGLSLQSNELSETPERQDIPRNPRQSQRSQEISAEEDDENLQFGEIVNPRLISGRSSMPLQSSSYTRSHRTVTFNDFISQYIRRRNMASISTGRREASNRVIFIQSQEEEEQSVKMQMYIYK